MRVAKWLTLRTSKLWFSCYATYIAQYCLVQHTNLKAIKKHISVPTTIDL